MRDYQKEFAVEFAKLDKHRAVISKYLKQVTDGIAELSLIIEGPAGVGKTTMVNKLLEEHGCKRVHRVKGKVTPNALFLNLHACRAKGNVFILDDADTALEDITTLNILKAATDTTEQREVTWLTSRALPGLPQQFTTEGTVIILSNNTFHNAGRSKKAEHLKALESRCQYYSIGGDDTFDDRLIHLFYVVSKLGMLSELQPDVIDEILSYIETRGDTFRQFDLRTADKLSKMYRTDPTGWKDAADVMM